MKVTEHIENAENTLISFEILPPKKGDNIKQLFDNIEPLIEFDPPFIDVTYHREEYVYRKKQGGLLEKQITRRRPGTVGICAAIKSKFDVDTVPHIICGGFSKEETENALIDLDFLGIDNILALRGDPIKSERNFIPHPEGHQYASELLEQIVQLNHGHYLYDDIEDAAQTSFCVGVAGYPEKHLEAPSYKSDLKWLKHKVDKGADYIVTQMFFDNEKFFEFVRKCRSIGITVPIIPGLKPITSLRQVNLLPKMFYIEMPEQLSDRLEACKTNKDVKNVGIDWCIQQSYELIDFGVSCLHFYSMGKSDPIYEIVNEVHVK